MKKLYIICLLTMGLITVMPSYAGTLSHDVEGRVVDTNGNAVEFATVVITSAGLDEIAGCAADAEGNFRLSVPGGDYTLTVQCVGYEPYSGPITIDGNASLGGIELAEKANEIDEVVIKAPTIVREADRFVMNVAGTTTAIGKNALEMLNHAPGVWVSEDKITLNGQSNVRVMIDERLMTMSLDDLMVYLRNISAEDIQKIEVIPSAGADYDASSQGGVIKITLKKQRRDGIEGSVEMRTRFAENSYQYVPSFNLNYRQDKVSLYTGFVYSKDRNTIDLTEETVYKNQGIAGVSVSHGISRSRYMNGRVGGIYDINDMQSIGAEFSISDNDGPQVIDAVTVMTGKSTATRDTSNYLTPQGSRRYAATLNYMLKLDTLGSFFKVIADYSSQRSNTANVYNTLTTLYSMPGMVYEGQSASLTDNNTRNLYDVFSITAAWEQRLGEKSMVKAGLKFIYNHMDDDAAYHIFDHGSEEWQFDTRRSMKQDFTEDIGAAYVIFNSKLGKLSYVAGLRGEYTYSSPGITMYDGQGYSRTSRDYLSLFPHANLSLPLNEKQTHSLVLSYGRGISRPSFWSLNPFKVQVSEYSYVTGDPNLKPTYHNTLDLSLILAHKYNITVGMRSAENSIRQMVLADEEDPQMIVYRQSNMHSDRSYYLSLNAPVTVAKWMTVNANLNLSRTMQKLTGESEKINYNSMHANVSSNITLPKKFFAELGYWYNSSAYWSNMRGKAQYNFNASLKKRLFKDKFTVSFDVRNILPNTSKTRLTVDDPQFVKIATQHSTWSRPNFSFTLRYNFRSGVTFKSRNVERSGDDSRM